MKYLINKTECYRIDTEDEAERFVEKLKAEIGEVVKYTIEHKETKDDEWYRLTIKRTYNIEKMPDTPFSEGDK